MPEATIQALPEAICALHGCDGLFVEFIPVRETFREAAVWDGAVAVFHSVGHPTAHRAHVWSSSVDGPERRRFVAVLHSPPVDAPPAAVRASIVAELRHG